MIEEVSKEKEILNYVDRKQKEFENKLGTYFIIMSTSMCLILFFYDLLNGDLHYNSCENMIYAFMGIGLSLHCVKSVEKIINIVWGKKI